MKGCFAYITRTFGVMLAIFATMNLNADVLFSLSDSYQARMQSLATLKDPISPVIADFVLDYLSKPDESLRSEQSAALKNALWNILQRSPVYSDRVAEVSIQMLSEGLDSVDVLDYAIQHLGFMLSDVSPSVASHAVSTLKSEALKHGVSRAGTALIALIENPGKTTDDIHFVTQTVIDILNKKDACEPVLITAAQLSGELGLVGCMIALESIAADVSRSVCLRVAAIGAIGCIGGASAQEFLQGLKSSFGTSPLKIALDAAITRIGLSLEGSKK